MRTGDRELTTGAHRRHQKQILEKSIASLENTPIAKRNHTSMTMAIDPALLPEAKRRMEKFTQELCDFLESGKRKQVYEMAVNLFPMSKEPRRNS